MNPESAIDYNCLICKNTEHKFLFTKGNADYYQCKTCNIHFQYPQPTYEDLEHLYGNTENIYQKQILDVSELHANLNFKYISKNINLSQYKSVLEIGCGPGFLLNHFRNHGYVCSGIEFSDWSKDYIKNSFDIDITVGDFSALNLDGQQFDFIVMSYVFEHLKNPDYVLHKINTLLNSNGILIMTTPNVSSIFRKVYRRFWRYYQPNEHIFLYGKNHIPQILERNNFISLKIKSIQGFKIFLYEFPKYTRSTLIRMLKNLILILPVRLNFWIFSINKWKPQKDLYIRPMSIFDNIIIFAQKC